MRTVIAAAAAILLHSTSAFAGPFGIEQGQPISSLHVSHRGQPGINYFLTTVPKPHPKFTRYSVTATPKQGVCRISAGTDVISNDKYGNDAQRLFDEIAAQLNDIYGPGEDFKYLRSGAIWNRQSEFIMSIYQSEREHSRSWATATGAKLKDGIFDISLNLLALSDNESFVTIQYIFDNFKSCKKEEKDVAAGAL